MRFRALVAEYYGIQMSEEHFQLIDSLFTSAGHHLVRHREALESNQPQAEFHWKEFCESAYGFQKMIYDWADFSNARDPQGYGLQDRESWNPDRVVLIHPHAFSRFVQADQRFPIGLPHIFDGLRPIRAARPLLYGTA